MVLIRCGVFLTMETKAIFMFYVYKILPLKWNTKFTRGKGGKGCRTPLSLSLSFSYIPVSLHINRNASLFFFFLRASKVYLSLLRFLGEGLGEGISFLDNPPFC